MEDKKRTLIITGGHTEHLFAKEFIQKHNFDKIIAADSGLMTLHELDIVPNVIVGDFDSVNPQILSTYKKNKEIKIHEYQSEKDYTDTEAAIYVAMEYNSEEVIILGATGSRIDHMISNINLLLKFLKQNITAYIIDKHNKIYLSDRDVIIYKEDCYGKYVSLIPITQEVLGVTLNGFKYPLNNHNLKKEESLGISNEITEEKAVISFTSGIMLIIESND